jgi:uncharacterized LabA/DUF88 family protein
MDRVAVFVDAGYLFAQGSALLAGRKLPRSAVTLDHEAARQALASFAERVSGRPLLRIYWYDGTSTGPTSQHLALAHLSDLKVRLGFVNSVGEQKGVDSLIVTDMIALARNRAISDAVLVSGDEDLRVGVQQAQEFGVRVHLVGIKPSRGSQSLFLLQESDTTCEWAEPDISTFFSLKPEPQLPLASAVPGPRRAAGVPAPVQLSDAERLLAVVEEISAAIDVAEVGALIEAFDVTRQVPMTVDRRLLAQSRAVLGRDLTGPEKRHAREALMRFCRARVPAPEDPTS